MEILTALKIESIRITCGNAWLFWNNQTEEWTVYARPVNARRNINLYTGRYLDEAIDTLIKGY